MSDTARQAADLLLAVRAGGPRIASLPPELRPADRAQAYAIQHLVAASFPSIGAWKVGAAGPDAEPQCGALPAPGVMPGPATISAHTMRGIEAEIAFRMATDLPPRPIPYSRAEVIDAIATAHPVIETLDSRYLDPDAVDAFANLADTQVHGGLVWGPGRADWHDIDFAVETVEQLVDGVVQVVHTGNPVGDMLRLVVWMANVGAVWSGGLKAGQFVTCGSWTGKEFVGPTAQVLVRFPSVGEVAVTFA